MAFVSRTLRASRNVRVISDNIEDYYSLWLPIVYAGLQARLPILRSMTPKDTGKMAGHAYVRISGSGSRVGVVVGFDVPYASYAGGDRIIEDFLNSPGVHDILRRASYAVEAEAESDNNWAVSLVDYAEQWGITAWRHRGVRNRRRVARNQDRNRDDRRERRPEGGFARTQSNFERRRQTAQQRLEAWNRARYTGSDYSNSDTVSALQGYAKKQLQLRAEDAERRRAISATKSFVLKVIRKAIIRF